MRTFVVRLWAAADEVEAHAFGPDDLHGTVEQVGAGDPSPFRSDRELLHALRGQLPAAGRMNAADGAARPLRDRGRP